MTDFLDRSDNVKEDTVIDLNVGGKLFSTFKSTLTKETDSMLAAMVDGKIPAKYDNSGRYFIDCDPEIFGYILEYLRIGNIPPLEKLINVYEYASRFNLGKLKYSLEKFKDVQYKRKGDLAKRSLDKEKYEQLLQSILCMFSTSRRIERKYICIVTVGNINDNLQECRCTELYLAQMNKIPICAKPLKPPIKTELQNNDNLLQALAGDLKLLGYNRLRYNKDYYCSTRFGLSGEHLRIVTLDKRMDNFLEGVAQNWIPI